MTTSGGVAWVGDIGLEFVKDKEEVFIMEDSVGIACVGRGALQFMGNKKRFVLKLRENWAEQREQKYR